MILEGDGTPSQWIVLKLEYLFTSLLLWQLAALLNFVNWAINHKFLDLPSLDTGSHLEFRTGTWHGHSSETA